MAKGKELKGRIRSTENTRKITRTMEMVATSKLKRATDRVAAARPYALALGEVLSHVYSPELADRFPLLRRPAAPRTVALVVLTANRGLCGAFNANLLKEARTRIAELEGRGLTVELHVVGRKGVGFFRYVNRALASQRTDITDKPTAADAASLIDDLMQRFAAGAVDAVYVTYAKYLSALSAPPPRSRCSQWPRLPPRPLAVFSTTSFSRRQPTQFSRHCSRSTCATRCIARSSRRKRASRVRSGPR